MRAAIFIFSLLFTLFGHAKKDGNLIELKASLNKHWKEIVEKKKVFSSSIRIFRFKNLKDNKIYYFAFHTTTTIPKTSQVMHKGIKHDNLDELVQLITETGNQVYFYNKEGTEPIVHNNPDYVMLMFDEMNPRPHQ